MVTERQCAVLNAIVRQYSADAFPVSSHDITRELPFRVSSATVRSDMAHLEQKGYLAQPHVSAGRIPTAMAFRFAASQLLDEVREQKTPHITQARIENPSQAAKNMAKTAGAISYVSAGRMPLFAGFEFVFTAPELRNEHALTALAHIMDMAQEWEHRIREALPAPMGIFIGEENPIFPSEYFSVVAVRLPQRGMLAILGPVRMDYPRAVAALRRFLAYE